VDTGDTQPNGREAAPNATAAEVFKRLSAGASMTASEHVARALEGVKFAPSLMASNTAAAEAFKRLSAGTSMTASEHVARALEGVKFAPSLMASNTAAAEAFKRLSAGTSMTASEHVARALDGVKFAPSLTASSTAAEALTPSRFASSLAASNAAAQVFTRASLGASLTASEQVARVLDGVKFPPSLMASNTAAAAAFKRLSAGASMTASEHVAQALGGLKFAPSPNNAIELLHRPAVGSNPVVSTPAQPIALGDIVTAAAGVSPVLLAPDLAAAPGSRRLVTVYAWCDAVPRVFRDFILAWAAAHGLDSLIVAAPGSEITVLIIFLVMQARASRRV
jgi:hypothetical protein